MVNIRRMNKEDCKEAAALEKEVLSLPWSGAGFVEALSMEHNIFLVAEEEGAVCGYIGMYVSLDEGEITNVAVSPAKRGHGIGDMLLEASLNEAKSAKLFQVVLEVRVSNEPAKTLYESMGFVPVGRRPRYYSRPIEDADILRKEL